MISATQKAHIRPVHPFPARMAPSIVWDALSNAEKQLTILDPMAGSGTTLVCARSKGHRAVGYDTDPLALLIARTWCFDIEPELLGFRAASVLERAKEDNERTSAADSYPRKADAETRQFIDFWFDTKTRRELASLSLCISRVRSLSERTFLWCAFSRLIITKIAGSSLAMDVSHSRPHKVYDVAPVRPFEAFLKAALTVAKNCPFRANETRAPVASVEAGDARAVPLASRTIDMIITSPPYLNAIDYFRGHRFTLVWMGHNLADIRALRSANIGSEISRGGASTKDIHDTMEAMVDLKSLDNRRLGMIQRYVLDMKNVMKETSRLLKPGGRAVYVVGNSAVRGVFVKNSEAIIRLAQVHRIELVSRTSRPLDVARRYLPAPEYRKAGAKMQTRMREEVVLEFIAN